MADKPAKRPKVTVDQEARMSELESQLFGGAGDVAAQLRLAAERGPGELEVVEDTAPRQASAKPAAWHDPQDAELRVDIADGASRARKLRTTEKERVVDGETYAARLRAQHAKLHPGVGWAARRGGPRDDGTAALLGKAGGLTVRGIGAAAPGTLEVSRLKDANAAEPAQAVIQSVQYHPNGQLLLTASLDKRLRFFSVDGGDNPLVQSVYLADMPVRRAAFTAGGAKVLATGRRKFFYLADLETAKLERIPGLFGVQDKSLEGFIASPSASVDVVTFLGQDGTLPMMSLKSRQLVGTLKMNGTARSGTYSADGMELYTAGGDGTVYIWDLRQRVCRGRFRDEGSLGATALAASASSGLLAAGSTSGVVNVYERTHVGANSTPASELGLAPELNPMPRTSVMSLVTSVDSLEFSPDGQVLALASRMKRDALRLMHVPSGTVYSNWPTSRSPLGYVHALAFSPAGGSLAIGNAKGHVLVYRLHHWARA